MDIGEGHGSVREQEVAEKKTGPSVARLGIEPENVVGKNLEASSLAVPTQGRAALRYIEIQSCRTVTLFTSGSFR